MGGKGVAHSRIPAKASIRTTHIMITPARTAGEKRSEVADRDSGSGAAAVDLHIDAAMAEDNFDSEMVGGWFPEDAEEAAGKRVFEAEEVIMRTKEDSAPDVSVASRLDVDMSEAGVSSEEVTTGDPPAVAVVLKPVHIPTASGPTAGRWVGLAGIDVEAVFREAITSHGNGRGDDGDDI